MKTMITNRLTLVLKTFFFYQRVFHNLAMTCDFQQCDILISVDSDEPLQSPFKLRNSK